VTCSVPFHEPSPKSGLPLLYKVKERHWTALDPVSPWVLGEIAPARRAARAMSQEAALSGHREFAKVTQDHWWDRLPSCSAVTCTAKATTAPARLAARRVAIVHADVAASVCVIVASADESAHMKQQAGNTWLLQFLFRSASEPDVWPTHRPLTRMTY
jgi:hypothetical protein